MSAASTATVVQKAVGWSIGLSVLMIVAGILAIASPLAAGVAVNLLVAWTCFQWMRPSGVCVAEAKRGRISLGVAGWCSLQLHRGISAHAAVGRLSVPDDSPCDLSVLGGDSGICLGSDTSPAFGIKLAPIRWDRYSDPRCHDLEGAAFERGVDHRHIRWDQYAV
jgi:hypothetical protein